MNNQKEIRFSIIERFIILNNLDTFTIRKNTEASELNYHIIPKLSFTDDEIKEYKLNVNTWSGDRSRYHETAPFEFQKHVAKSIFDKYIHMLHSFSTYLILYRLLEFIGSYDYDLNDEEIQSVKYIDVKFDNPSDILTLENVIFNLLNAGEDNWVNIMNDKKISIDDLREIIKYYNYISFKHDEIETYDIKTSKIENGIRIETNVDDNKEELDKLLTRTVPEQVRNNFVDIVYKLGFDSQNYIAFQKLNVLPKDDMYDEYVENMKKGK